ncbi:MAG: hypothetical protein COW63_09415 [Bacteroidetes bacterium CG18_big_fil_WC_8_21_14_2_50_41_14]|nr:MAG: hypothetical protein COW63_09415 [Bacteroidetes bacterium CG18_big_fil_WC_8_21_14_2_50_41_14]PJB55018.1 MAG: hypothetical protein CO098_18580 [Bacteroidetes bacterium CG_4_9_14_3_um_filter_41_19]
MCLFADYFISLSNNYNPDVALMVMDTSKTSTLRNSYPPYPGVKHKLPKVSMILKYNPYF